MKNFTILPNCISAMCSPNDLYTLTGLYLTANEDYVTDSTYDQIAKLTGQSKGYIKDGFMLRLNKCSKLCSIESYIQDGLRRKKYFLFKPSKNFRIIKKEVLTDSTLSSEEKGFIIALYCNSVNNSFNLSLSSWEFWKSRLNVAKSTFYKLRKALIDKNYLIQLAYIPMNPESENHPDDYMLCVPWLGHKSYVEELNKYRKQ